MADEASAEKVGAPVAIMLMPPSANSKSGGSNLPPSAAVSASVIASAEQFIALPPTRKA